MFPFAVVVFPKFDLFDFGIHVIVFKVFKLAWIESFCVSRATFDGCKIAGKTVIGEIFETPFVAVSAVCCINVEIRIFTVFFTFIFIMVAINVEREAHTRSVGIIAQNFEINIYCFEYGIEVFGYFCETLLHFFHVGNFKGVVAAACQFFKPALKIASCVTASQTDRIGFYRESVNSAVHNFIVDGVDVDVRIVVVFWVVDWSIR